MYDYKNLDLLPKLGGHAPDNWDAFTKFNDLALSDGAISKKHKELMAVAIALMMQCPYCIETHRRAAIEAGASIKELSEASFVAATIRASGAMTHATHLMGGQFEG